MPPGLSDRALVAFTLSASIASTIGGLPFNALPVMLGSLADSFALDPQAVGLMGSVCFAGYLAGTLVAPLWINRMNWRVLTAASATGTAASFVPLTREAVGIDMGLKSLLALSDGTLIDNAALAARQSEAAACAESKAGQAKEGRHQLA